MSDFDAKFGPPPLANADVAAQIVVLTLIGYASRVSFLCTPDRAPSLVLSFAVACCVAALTVGVARARSNA